MNQSLFCLYLGVFIDRWSDNKSSGVEGWQVRQERHCDPRKTCVHQQCLYGGDLQVRTVGATGAATTATREGRGIESASACASRVRGSHQQLHKKKKKKRVQRRLT